VLDAYVVTILTLMGIWSIVALGLVVYPFSRKK